MPPRIYFFGQTLIPQIYAHCPSKASRFYNSFPEPVNRPAKALPPPTCHLLFNRRHLPVFALFLLPPNSASPPLYLFLFDTAWTAPCLPLCLSDPRALSASSSTCAIFVSLKKGDTYLFLHPPRTVRSLVRTVRPVSGHSFASSSAHLTQRYIWIPHSLRVDYTSSQLAPVKFEILPAHFSFHSSRWL